MAWLIYSGAVHVVEWLERLVVVRKVAGSSSARAKDWKTLTVHPVVISMGI